MKTSYRLALGDKGPLLQGWAIVENTTKQDWKDVKVTLVSGRPVSFQMDLYQPMFADRPVVVPELFANLQHRTTLTLTRHASYRAGPGHQ